MPDTIRILGVSGSPIKGGNVDTILEDALAGREFEMVRLSGYLAAFIDRMRVYVHGNVSRGLLRNKVGAAVGVASARSAVERAVELSRLLKAGKAAL